VGTRAAGQATRKRRAARVRAGLEHAHGLVDREERANRAVGFEAGYTCGNHNDYDYGGYTCVTLQEERGGGPLACLLLLSFLKFREETRTNRLGAPLPRGLHGVHMCKP
jgi:hypothetical protein